MLSDCAKNIILLLFILVVGYYVVQRCSKEKFEDTSIANVNYAAGYNQTLDSMPKRPSHYDVESGNMVPSSGFVQQELEHAWGSPYADGAEGEVNSVDYSSVDLRTAPCSQSCCSPQYPTPFKLNNDEDTCANKDKFVASNLMCNNEWQDTGCMCLTEKQSEFLETRGGNAY